jgi:hypothetical protein
VTDPSGKSAPSAETPPSNPDPPESWIVRHRWKIGLAAAGLLGGWWWQRSRGRRRISVDRVSEDWLMQHEVEAGKEHRET